MFMAFHCRCLLFSANFSTLILLVGLRIHFIYRLNADLISTLQSLEFLYRCLIGKDLIDGGIESFWKYGLLGCF